MKKLKFIFGKLSILYYILFLLVTCVLCKYGSIRQLKFAFGFRYPSGTQSLYLDRLPDRRKMKIL